MTPSDARNASLTLALAPGLTPDGPVHRPQFFHGCAVHPQVVTRGLLALADITATRYSPYTPAAHRDPVLTAQGDRLRAECFSACTGVYARLDLLESGLDGGDIMYGTTNVDMGRGVRKALAAVAPAPRLQLAIGDDRPTISGPDASAVERPVDMPTCWIRGLGNVATLHHGLTAAATVGASASRRFLGALPSATGVGRSGWLAENRGELRLSARPGGSAVYLEGLHRLSAAKRLLPHVEGLTVYGPADRAAGPLVLELQLPTARLVLGLTSESCRGHSGEDSLLSALTAPHALAQAKTVSALLSFDPVVDVPDLARRAAIEESAAQTTLAVLAGSGRAGWDLHDGAHFHRQLPDSQDRVAADNPRAAAAQQLVANGALRRLSPTEWTVRCNTADYLVRLSIGGHWCTCAWFLCHANTRGPCPHILAVQRTTTNT
ncbi:hypothetical protein FB466_1598 [Klugiella xanthotipulae]|uniref:SWIM-type domain-containing protein n=1 Tax=Klugiella xanthotipulae TaxID=244735 RepID=A0A543HYE7_9MICO|nr:hypothetical protein FB466_1598 [Klugiella xanthotipulae]